MISKKKLSKGKGAADGNNSVVWELSVSVRARVPGACSV